eukprot:TRINITY_DN3152_c0_g1_i1.p1 TRINITY_DN3152_c0_g1~~TRINITY_DN3152_c0_g1_i1.p1  ORF type:complete len:241 (-),score=53.69 TRINITY_DN3152_c0_g1_i1:104-826(-)
MAEEAQLHYSEVHKKLLEDFVKSDKGELEPLIPILKNISITGLSCYNWEELKQLLTAKLEKVLGDFNTSAPLPDFEEKKEVLKKFLNGFTNPPFTIQRLCELLLNPSIYSNTRNYVHALEKVLTVTSTQPTRSKEEYNELVAKQQENFAAIKDSKAKFNQKNNNNSTMDMSTEKPMDLDESLKNNTTGRTDTHSVQTVFPESKKGDSMEVEKDPPTPIPESAESQEQKGDQNESDNRMDQ